MNLVKHTRESNNRMAAKIPHNSTRCEEADLLDRKLKINISTAASGCMCARIVGVGQTIVAEQCWMLKLTTLDHRGAQR